MFEFCIFDFLQEGVNFQQLDKVIIGFGWLVGMVILVDEVGIDVVVYVVEDFGKVFGSRFGGGDLVVLKEMVVVGFLGVFDVRFFYLLYSFVYSICVKMYFIG